MVVFTCGHCGESVQKPKVEKHYLTICRNRNPNLSCMDCFKDFLGQDYESHIKCITEEERYSGKGFVSKEKKGIKTKRKMTQLLKMQNTNGTIEETDEKSEENGTDQNGDVKENGEEQQNGEEKAIDKKKLTKKQRKEEKNTKNMKLSYKVLRHHSLRK
uniref:Zinc finger C2H2 LYAR-type domain-containing protein n=1 Tax=Heliothis virescens TaxID=7102 RepID=A0A2A4IVN6_HELVI